MIVPFKTIENEIYSCGWDCTTKIVYQENAFCNNQLFVDYLREVVCEEIERRRSVYSIQDQRAVVMMDQCTSHCSIEVKTLLQSHNIDIIFWPSHCSHLVQPLDLSLFGITKSKYMKKLWNFDFDSAEQKERVIRALAVLESFHISATPGNVVSSFRKIGLFPGYDERFKSKRDSFIDPTTINQ